MSENPALDLEEMALSKYEEELERMISENLTNGQDQYAQRLFLAFQNAATNVTKMFRNDRMKRIIGIHFMLLQESVTMLYKESLDALKDAIQLSILNGEQQKTKDILRWTRRQQRPYIRTREIYDHLIDRPFDELVRPPETTTNQPPIVDDLQTFRQALVINDNEHPNPLGASSPDHSEQLENFVRQQVADQLARKRDYHSPDSDLPKSKRARHT